jgi:hypothetical protein
MSDDVVTTSVSVPLDGDGFLRRECPTCEREFKWLHSEDGTAGDIDHAGYYCPYCAVQANDGWLTQAQVEIAQATLIRDVVDPMLDRFGRDLERSSSGAFKINTSRQPSPEPPELSEPDDMRRVTFTCHPLEPLKVHEEWAGPVHCLICGLPAVS